MMHVIDELYRITPQRPLVEIVKECDIAFAGRSLNLIDITTKIVDDPFRAGLDYTRKQGKISLVVVGGYFTKISPDATWMRALRLYQSLQEDPRKEVANA